MAKSIVPKLVIAYNFARTAIADLLSLAQTVFTNMAANAAVFTTPPVSLAKLKSDVDNLMISSAAATEGAKKDIIQRDKDRHALEQDLRLLGAYVIHVANGDPAILASSGFVAAPARTRGT